MIEAAIGRPVLAAVWRSLRHCGIDRPFPSHGTLLHLQAEAGP